MGTHIAMIMAFLASLGSAGSLAPSSPFPMTAPAQGQLLSTDQKVRSDLINEQVVTWDRYTVLNPTTVRVGFGKAHSSCTGVRYEVQSSVTDITITVFEGAYPGAATACPEILEFASLVITLDTPIGHRHITQ